VYPLFLGDVSVNSCSSTSYATRCEFALSHLLAPKNYPLLLLAWFGNSLTNCIILFPVARCVYLSSSVSYRWCPQGVIVFQRSILSSFIVWHGEPKVSNKTSIVNMLLQPHLRLVSFWQESSSVVKEIRFLQEFPSYKHVSCVSSFPALQTAIVGFSCVSHSSDVHDMFYCIIILFFLFPCFAFLYSKCGLRYELLLLPSTSSAPV
jgi:hypothetical protein